MVRARPKKSVPKAQDKIGDLMCEQNRSMAEVCDK